MVDHMSTNARHELRLPAWQDAVSAAYDRWTFTPTKRTIPADQCRYRSTDYVDWYLVITGPHGDDITDLLTGQNPDRFPRRKDAAAAVNGQRADLFNEWMGVGNMFGYVDGILSDDDLHAIGIDL